MNKMDATLFSAFCRQILLIVVFCLKGVNLLLSPAVSSSFCMNTFES
jgi:hypothetical protein